MAPPRHRDRGFSRRIQYGLFIGYVAAVAGIVMGLALVLVARFDPLAFQGIRGLALDLTAPVSGASRNVAVGAGQIGREVGGYLDAVDRNRALEGELVAARRAIVQAQATELENRRLRRLVGLMGEGARPVAAARIVGSDLAGARRYATLSAGAAHGVRAGQPVRGPDGLVGRIAEAGRNWSRVELLTDGGSTVPVRVARTGQSALAAGRGEGNVDVRATVLGQPPFRIGDLLFTSGTGGVFPAGIPVAVVTQVNGEVAIARPLADPARLDVALVLPEAPVAPPPPVAAR